MWLKTANKKGPNYAMLKVVYYIDSGVHLQVVLVPADNTEIPTNQLF